MKVFKLKNTEENLKKLDLFKEWSLFLMENKEEVLRTLDEENLLSEKVGLVNFHNELYLVCENVVKPGEQVLPSNKERVLNRIHKGIWSLLEKEVLTEPFDFENEEILYSFKADWNKHQSW